MVMKFRSVILSNKENTIPRETNGSVDVQRKITEDVRRLNCSENVYEEAVYQCIKIFSKVKCYEVLNDYDIVSHIVCGSEKNKDF